MVSQEEQPRVVFLTKPLSLESETSADFRAPNILKRVLSLFRNVRPGSDLSRMQISHHPPVTALHATDEKSNIEMIWCRHPYGTSMEAEVHGKRELKLLNHGETYEMDSPKLVIKFLPFSWVNWVGDHRIPCQGITLEAELHYGSLSYFGLRGNPRSVKGKIFNSSSLEPIYEIDGQWDRTIRLKDVSSG